MTPFDGPKLRPDLPVYPGALQLLRVTSATIPGPSGGVSSGIGTGNIAPTVLYVAETQQSRTDTLSPRDREPCLVLDPSGLGLLPGYYLGRLVNTYQSLPVYMVSAVPGPSGVPGPLGPAGPSGIPGVAPPLAGAQVNRGGADITLVRNTRTAIIFSSSAAFDTAPYWDGSTKLVIPGGASSSYYDISGNFTMSMTAFAAATAINAFNLLVYGALVVNGATLAAVLDTEAYDGADTDTATNTVLRSFTLPTKTISLVAGDYLEMMAYYIDTPSGGTAKVLSEANNYPCWMQLVKR